ncbi:MAG: helix-turn-helix domain-containing protein [Catenulispora sp.]|nr:helix-turn-helix domain-containing protein [Catenulispora sp.]
MSETLGERIRAVRVARGMSQAELARDLFTASYVSLIEADKRVPEQPVLEQLADRLDTTADYLKTGHDPAKVQDQQLAVNFAELALANGQLDDALTRFRELVTGTPPALRSRAVWGVARVLEAQGDLQGAITAVESLVDDARADRAHEPSLLALLNNRCGLYREAGDLNHSIELGASALAEARELGLSGTEEEIRLATTLVGCYWDRGDLTRAHLLVQEVIKRAEEHGSHQAKGSVYWNASLVAEARGQRHLAIHMAERAVALLGEGADDYSLAKIRVVLAWMLLRATPPSVDRAEEILQRSLEIMSLLGVDREIAGCEIELARVRLLQGRPVEAAEFTLRVIERLGGVRDGELARATLVHAQALIAGGDTKGGVVQVHAALDIIGGLTRRRQQAQLLREAADILVAVNQLADAVDAYRRLADCVGTTAAPAAGKLNTAQLAGYLTR